MLPEVAARTDRPVRVPRILVDPLVREIGSWLDGPDPAAVAATTALWGLAEVGAARRLIAAHGIAPFLARDPEVTRAVHVLPGALRTWIVGEGERNRLRMDRLHDELAAALRRFQAAGIPVMPLKGSILTTRPGHDPYRRPMADLDLLVLPEDLGAARTTLESLGYRRRSEAAPRSTHDGFERVGNDRVVSWDGEHPDNPRRVELHTEVTRHLWGWVDDDDLTTMLWSGAREGRLLGEPAVLPTEQALLAHLAIHATSDLLLERGRLVQWLDLVDVAGPASQADLAGLPHPRLAFPALRLAVRRLPGRRGRLELGSLEALVPPGLARWASSVSLDTHAGLQAGRLLPREASTLRGRWSRWAPIPWRLLVAYGDVPLPFAVARHAMRVASIGRRGMN